jgi:hypothetical protein
MKRQKEERVLPLGPVLESAVVGALVSQRLGLKAVHREELSKIGQAIYRTLKENDGNKVSHKVLKVACTEVHGIDPAEYKEYFAELILDSDIEGTLSTLRRKRVVNNLVNEATLQIASGEYSILSIKGILDTHAESTHPLSPLSDDAEEAAPPQGLAVKQLQRLMQAVPSGIFGLWVIGGEPKAGKSTLALQLALTASKNHRPVLYYDFELGKSVLKWHIEQALGGDKDLIARATKRLFVRNSIHTLEQDLDAVKEPCLVVVDSIQKIGSSVQFRRESIDQWVHKLEALKKRGHHVIMVSEVNRATYGEPSGSGFKESGEIEYSADTAFCLTLPDEQNAGVVDLHILYNRHFRKRGLVCQLERHNSWWFKERGGNNG